MQINLYDANNFFRVLLETDTTGRPVSKLYSEIQSCPSDIMSIIVWDGANSLQRRRDLYPEYKAKRRPPSDPTIFKAMDNLRAVLALSKAITVRVEGWEADDVIADIVKKFRDQGVEEAIILHSNDADFAQLGVTMTDPPRLAREQEAQWVPLYKTLVGDPSDNIPGLKGFGESSWKNLAFGKPTLRKFVSDLTVPMTREELFEALPNTKQIDALLKPGVRDTLNLYWRLINFLPLPEGLVDQCMIKGTDDPIAAHKIFQEFNI